MPERKEIRRQARRSLKKHYWFFVALCLLAAILGTEYADTLQAFQLQKRVEERRGGTDPAPGIGRMSGEMSVFNDLVNGDLDGAIEALQHRVDVYTGKDTYIGDIELGHSKGVLSSVVNSIASGSLLMSVLTAIDTILAVHSTGRGLLALLGLAAMVVFWLFIANVYRVVYARMFLEGRIYEKVPFSRSLYLFRLKKHVKASLSMALYMLLQYLWLFTVVLYPVKRYAYYLAPFLVAENPDLSPPEAIRLSKRMMEGHKLEAFRLELSLLPWKVLSFATGGLIGLFFYNPYKECVRAEYHAWVRAAALKGKVDGSGRLADRYLYEIPSSRAIDEAYPDEVKLSETRQERPEPRTGFWGFTEKYLGIVPDYDGKEKANRAFLMFELRKEEYRDTLEGKTYPVRLNPFHIREKHRKTDDAGYMRNYTIPSVILLFFLLCVFGWLWEVALHLVQAGEFVNRGTLHGPWLPIYGGGCAAILALLYRLRKKPFTEFLMIIVVCAIIEYSTSWILEVMNDGQRWWDYSGYYLNLNGRICAEGLLVFGIGGAAFVYVIAPFADNLIVRLRKSVLWGICAALLAVFLADVVYSSSVPNIGEGITSAAVRSREVTAQGPSGTGRERGNPALLCEIRGRDAAS